MSKTELSLSDISFAYDSSTSPVLNRLTVSFPHGWTGIVGANGAGKTTLMMVAVGSLQHHKGAVDRPPRCIYCAQRTDDPPDLFAAFLDDWEAEACRLRGVLGIALDWLERWSTLSHGERKRSQIAVALWQEPDVLAVDEPTNHLDIDARAMLKSALKSFYGIGMIVSHDRDLLDDLCGRCLFLESGNGVIRPGGVSAGLQEEEREHIEALRLREAARSEVKRLEAEASKRRALAASQQKRRSKKGIPLKDHDARFKKNRARISGKDGVGGRLLRQMDGRLKQAEDLLDSTPVRRRHASGITVHGERSRSDALIRLEKQTLNLGETKFLDIPELTILPSDRIAIVGANGSGKSTLVRKIIAEIQMGREHLTYVPQEIDKDTTLSLRTQVLGLPAHIRGNVMSAVSRLGSRPERVLESVLFSPGEARKVTLALGLGKVPHLIVMDEPTNHMDLPSIRSVEDALRDAGCALLLVSHDTAFIDSLTDTTWRIDLDAGSSGARYRLSVDSRTTALQ